MKERSRTTPPSLIKSALEDTKMPPVPYKMVSYTVGRPLSVKGPIGLMVIGTVLTLLLVNLNLLLQYVAQYKKQRNWYRYQTVDCVKPEMYQREMENLAVNASNVLHTLGLTSAACFGTLVGALRRGRVLPWDNNVDLCVVDQIAGDFETVQREFMAFEIVLKPYDPWQGHYAFSRDGVHGFIHVFTKCSVISYLRFRGEVSQIYQVDHTHEDQETAWLCQHGMLPYVAQILHGLDKPIPASLFRSPLPTMPYGKGTILIPHGDGQILKYLYPESWWLDMRPVGC